MVEMTKNNGEDKLDDSHKGMFFKKIHKND